MKEQFESDIPSQELPDATREEHQEAPVSDEAPVDLVQIEEQDRKNLEETRNILSELTSETEETLDNSEESIPEVVRDEGLPPKRGVMGNIARFIGIGSVALGAYFGGMEKAEGATGDSGADRQKKDTATHVENKSNTGESKSVMDAKQELEALQKELERVRGELAQFPNTNTSVEYNTVTGEPLEPNTANAETSPDTSLKGGDSPTKKKPSFFKSLLNVVVPVEDLVKGPSEDDRIINYNSRIPKGSSYLEEASKDRSSVKRLIGPDGTVSKVILNDDGSIRRVLEGPDPRKKIKEKTVNIGNSPNSDINPFKSKKKTGSSTVQAPVPPSVDTPDSPPPIKERLPQIKNPKKDYRPR